MVAGSAAILVTNITNPVTMGHEEVLIKYPSIIAHGSSLSGLGEISTLAHTRQEYWRMYHAPRSTEWHDTALGIHTVETVDTDHHQGENPTFNNPL